MSAPAQPRLSLAGKLLLAMPDMPDARFERAVILLCVHDEGGALGIALHEPMEGMGLHGLLGSLGIDAQSVGDEPVLQGGPVEPRRGFVLHSRDWMTADSHPIDDEIALTGSMEVLHAVASGGGPARWLVALGYAGWSAGQLETELAAPGWYLSKAQPYRLFSMAPENRWAGAFSLEGIDPAMLTGNMGHA
ncbi:putative transcriptional regulator [Sphingobium sp. B7D2B]|uniref:YqgE/AlgH family protein n=1 Tax=unclassified Sphingobium TaxID=2611147 RepID=UPI0022242D33|nr:MULTISPECIES: YqgE/AlgH family protein [unclassified Sphingobium]MCW2366483.1 putative transcriptional regulator [Sphingobium sp. B7D2B]MCW2394451.1 putative transcriptional regulator [Sphingobium sp. B8D3B]MCW2417965.1 putative transcriptional regulator [Sphingobium sp. B8D3C]